MRKFDYKFIDNHIHLHDPGLSLAEVIQDFESADVDRFCLLCVSNQHTPFLNQNPQGLLYKHLCPNQLFTFIGCDYGFTHPEGQTRNAPDFPTQVERFSQLGVDGWKFLESKPTHFDQALQSDFFRPLFESLEQAKLPLLWHVGDPIEFWDKDALPEWAPKQWAYEKTHPQLEDLRADALTVIERYPNIQFILAHVFFMGYELDRARALLERFPTVSFDLAPGVEMFFGFSQDPEASHRFFTDFADRILLGSDRGVMDMPAAPRIEMIRRFLETDDSFDPPHSDVVMWPEDRGPIRGIKLDDDSLRKIHKLNFEALVGSTPKPFDHDAARKEVERLLVLWPDKTIPEIVLSRWDD